MDYVNKTQIWIVIKYNKVQWLLIDQFRAYGYCTTIFLLKIGEPIILLGNLVFFFFCCYSLIWTSAYYIIIRAVGERVNDAENGAQNDKRMLEKWLLLERKWCIGYTCFLLIAIISLTSIFFFNQAVFDCTLEISE